MWRRLGHRRPPVVFCYHAFGVRPPHSDPFHLFVSMERFRQQLDLLERRGWQPIDGDQYLAGMEAGTWPKKAFLVTMDDGYDSTLLAIEELARRRISSLIFVPPSRVGGTSIWIPEMRHERLLTIADLQALPADVEIGVHGGDHTDLPGLSTEELRRQVHKSADDAAAITGRRPRFFAYPSGLHDAAARHAVADAGYAAAFATHRGRGAYARRRVDVLSIDNELTFALKLQPWYGAARRLGPRLGPMWHLARRALRL